MYSVRHRVTLPRRSIQCERCPAGFNSGDGNTLCVSCAAGRFASSIGDKCVNCPWGYVRAGDDTVPPVAYPATRRTRTTPARQFAFRAFRVGQNQKGKSTCPLCPAGRAQARGPDLVVSAQMGVSPLRMKCGMHPCSPGTYRLSIVSEVTVAACQSCPAGWAQSLDRQSANVHTVKPPRLCLASPADWGLWRRSGPLCHLFGRAISGRQR